MGRQPARAAKSVARLPPPSVTGLPTDLRDSLACREHCLTKRGDAYNQTYCYVFRVREGRIVEVVEHCDTALVDRVLEPVR